ncbi:hypothetical protein [Litorihabitans aurantiacus]|uniref:FlgD Ig-like domain-containing protein n=1 Tax=Litorihabitans aurantiacus TaxID=1930061 RepID=A0AA37UGR1_9MICO|nr:hypothetical protein [Litorihabitans aurantiacus]GMA30318.1 hypothetical protein GCM10025875_03100 [Litorihabitans aurantiacus]
MTLAVDVATTSDVPCLVDLGSGATMVEISSGEDPVWSSAQCPFAPESRRLLLGEDAEDSQSLTWNGTRCDGGEVAGAGTYRIVVTHELDGQRLTGEATLLLQ